MIEASVRGLRPEMVLAHVEVRAVFEQNGVECRITSTTGGTHSVGSLHYVGAAVDYGLAHVSSLKMRKKLAKEIRKALGPDFDVVLERTHIHVEFQPKVALN